MQAAPPPDESARKAALIAGFTLIELSIVLVIIGLVVGGVLVGRDLINAAEIRSLLKEQEQFKTAAATFRGKYDCLPGDCWNAMTFGFATNGNGDGIMGDPTGDLFNGLNAEQLSFWQQLFQAGLIPSNGIAFAGMGYVPANIRSDTWWVGYSAHSGGWPGYATGPLGNVLALVGVPGQCGFNTCGGARFSEDSPRMRHTGSIAKSTTDCQTQGACKHLQAATGLIRMRFQLTVLGQAHPMNV